MFYVVSTITMCFFLYTLFNKCKMTFESLTNSRNMQSEHKPEDGIRGCE